MSSVDDEFNFKNDDKSYEVDELFKNVQDMGDLYFISLLILSQMEGKSEDSPLAELSYLLDSQSFMNLLWYFEGQTIRIPTRDELKDVLQMMLLYYYYDIKDMSWFDAVDSLGLDHKDRKLSHRLWKKYLEFIKILKDVKLPNKLKGDN